MSAVDELVRASLELETAAKTAEQTLLVAFRRAEAKAFSRIAELMASAPRFDAGNLTERLRWYFQNIPSLEIGAAQAGYLKSAKSYLDKYPNLGYMAEGILLGGRIPKDMTAIPKELIRALQGRDMRFFKELNDEALRKLDRVFLDSVIVGRTPAGALQELKGVITGSYPWGKKTGLYEWHAGTYARTANMRFSRQILKAKADDLNLQHFIYVGPVDAKKRKFCLQIVGQAFSRAQIEEMDNGLTGDVFSEGGGYNCRDTWSPIDKSLFDELQEDPVKSKTAVKESIKKVSKPPKASELIKGEAPAYPKKPTVANVQEWGANYGIKIETGGATKALSAADTLTAYNHLGKIPPKLLKRVSEKGGKLEIFGDGGITAHPDNLYLKGVRPRGWPKGSSWDQVGGMAAPSRKKAYVLANESIAGHGSRSTTIHEWTHIADEVLGQNPGGLSYADDFQAIWRGDKLALKSAKARRTRMLNKYKKGLAEWDDVKATYPEEWAQFIDRAYFKKYPEEYFAEGLARYLMGDKDLISKGLVEYFDRLIAGGI